MPVGEIAGELLGGLLRLVGRFFLEVVIEILIKGTGFLICKPFNKRIAPDGIIVVFFGFMFWILIGYLSFLLYRYIIG